MSILRLSILRLRLRLSVLRLCVLGLRLRLSVLRLSILRLRLRLSILRLRLRLSILRLRLRLCVLRLRLRFTLDTSTGCVDGGRFRSVCLGIRAGVLVYGFLLNRFGRCFHSAISAKSRSVGNFRTAIFTKHSVCPLL